MFALNPIHQLAQAEDDPRYEGLLRINGDCSETEHHRCSPLTEQDVRAYTFGGNWTGALREAYAVGMAAGTKSGSVEWMLLVALGCLIALIVYTAR